MYVVLSLVALTVKSEVPSGNSANTTILAVLGVEFAVKVSDTNVKLLFKTDASNCKNTAPSPPFVGFGLDEFAPSPTYGALSSNKVLPDAGKVGYISVLNAAS